MTGTRLLMISVAVLCVVALCMSAPETKVSAQSAATPEPVYNPYPPGILPSDLNSELARVLREVDSIEAEAINNGTPCRLRLQPVNRPYFKTPVLPR